MARRIEYHFRCPECHETFTVDDVMRTLLAEQACLFCGTPVEVGAFTPRPADEGDP